MNGKLNQRTLRKFAKVISGFIILLIIWWGLVVLRLVSHVIVPTPGEVVLSLVRLIGNTNLQLATIATFQAVILSWILGLAIAALLSIIVALRGQYLPYVLNPPVVFLRTLPSVIAVPLFAAAFGSTRLTGILCSAILVYAYTYSVFIEGFRESLTRYHRTATVIGLPLRKRIELVYIPATVPIMLAGAKQGFGIALVVTIAAEMLLGLSPGLGKSASDLSWLLRMDMVWAILIVLFILSIIINAICDSLQRAIPIWAHRRLNLRIRSIYGSENEPRIGES